MKKGLCIVVGVFLCLPALPSDLPVHSMLTPQTTPPPINIPQPVTIPEKLGVYSDAEIIVNYKDNGKSRSLHLGAMHPPIRMTGPTTAEHTMNNDKTEFRLCIAFAIGAALATITLVSLMWFVKNLMSKRREG
jgi:hypothetical protein